VKAHDTDAKNTHSAKPFTFWLRSTLTLSNDPEVAPKTPKRKHDRLDGAFTLGEASMFIRTSLTALIAAAALQSGTLAQDVLPNDANAERIQGQNRDSERPTLRSGLNGAVSAETERALSFGNRVPVIVILQAPKVQDRLDFFAPRGMDGEQVAIQALRDRVLLDAFGGNGINRADLAQGEVARLPVDLEGRQNPRPTLTRSFQATPGFALRANAREIAALRATQGVSAVYEDRPEPLLLQDSTTLVGADDVWSQSVEGAGYAIAILDSGVENEHPMTASAISASACFNQVVPGVSSSNCPGGVAQVTSLTSASAGDSCVEAVLDAVNGTNGCFHGTHVGSTAAGRSTSLSSGPIAGVARQADLIAVNVFARFPANQCPQGSTQPCILSWTSDQIAALDWLYANRATLNLAAVNMSLGGGQNFSSCDGSDPRTTVINNLRSAGIATVIASGNNGFSNAVSTPGCISSAITVGATTKTDAVASYSNASSLVDLMAPGSAITAAWQSEEPAPGQNCIAAGTPRAPGPDGFCHWFSGSSGTSMATPHVAGAFALLKDAFPSASVTDIELALENTGVPIFDSRNGQTYPRIQIDAALAQLAGGGGGTPSGPANNDFADRIALNSGSTSTTGTNVGADKEAGEPNHRSAGGASVWWSWTATSSARVTITTFGSNYDTLLGVYTGNAVNALTTVRTNDDAGGTLQSRVRFFPTPGVTYHIAVDGYNGASGNISLNISQ